MAIDLVELRREIYAQVLHTLQTEPTLTYSTVADMHKVCRKTVCNIAKNNGIRRPRGRKPRYLTEVK